MRGENAEKVDVSSWFTSLLLRGPMPERGSAPKQSETKYQERLRDQEAGAEFITTWAGASKKSHDRRKAAYP
ncbi:hypothetical protein VN97_g2221 [Penicillium thymicola]|uniref:Uncharacterized protein n=1 Tax=Penicillium thymicola TaxID=293382 RepID=A0AAI9TPD5_PENTH|nr:hypothetical protein VN97_g2221 [Penicillium thymicola]